MLAKHKTKLVCTIGPATDTIKMMVKMIHAGMNIARLNYSHGDFAQHNEVIQKLRKASAKTGKTITIMADLPGPKVRIGQFASEPVLLRKGADFTLSTMEIEGDQSRVYVNLPTLPEAVKKGNIIFLNDGIIQLKVKSVEGYEVLCKVVSGGELRSRKGLNLPGIKLGISAFTDHDHACLKAALEGGVDAVSQSFVESAKDVETVRNAALELGYKPFIIAKIERADALRNINAILQAADGIMIARGDLGVEIRIERIAIVQKHLTFLAIKYGKPVITATQMLESMVDNPRPTRAEATDVANAILDGTDCIMLSEESAIGKYPVEAAQMLSKIAKTTEPQRSEACKGKAFYDLDTSKTSIVDILSHNVQQTVEYLNPVAVFVPTHSGRTPRLISRFKLPMWIVGVTHQHEVYQNLQFSYGVQPLLVNEHPCDWHTFIADWVHKAGLKQGLAVLTEGPSRSDPLASHSLQIIDLRTKSS
jgi:pyruvate kinase